jgi:import inner membrane translocase subunit TIM17
MGAVGGGIWYGIKGARNSPRVRRSLSPFLACSHFTGRASRRRSLIYKSPRTRDWRQFWCLGRHVLHLRLCYQGLAAKGGRVERYSLWVYDRRLSRCTQSVSFPLLSRARAYILPGGPRSALGSAIACGILLGVFEGVGVLISRVFSEGNRPQMAPRMSFILCSQPQQIYPSTVPAGMSSAQPSSPLSAQ